MEQFIRRLSFLSLLLLLTALPSLVKAQAAHGAEDYTYTFVNDARLNRSFGAVSDDIDMTTGTTTLFAPGIAGTNDVYAGYFKMPFIWVLGRSGAAASAYYYASASENGVIRLATGAGTLSANTYNQTVSGEVRLAPFGFNLRVKATTKVHYKVVGTEPNRVVVIEHRNMEFNSVGGITASDLTFQTRLYESTGLIEFVYGEFTFTGSGTVNPSIGIGHNNITAPNLTFAALNATFTSGTRVLTAPTNDFTQVQAMSSATEGSRRAIRMQYATSLADPTAGSASPIFKTTATLNWTDNSTNESGFVAYRSQPGGGAPYEFAFFRASSAAEQTATGTRTQIVTGLVPNTNYIYKVYSVRQGRISTSSVDINFNTAASVTFTSNKATGLWTTAADWNTGTDGTPADGDIVTIAAGHTYTLTNTGNCADLTVDGTLNFEGGTNNRTLNVSRDMVVNGTVQTPLTGSARTHVLNISRNLTVNTGGVLNLSRLGESVAHQITLNFLGTSDATFTVATGSTVDFHNQPASFVVNKTNPTLKGTGLGYETMLEMVLNAVPTVGNATPTASTTRHITLTSGTLKISGSATWTTQGPLVSGLFLPANAGLWMNNANLTLSPGNYSPTYDGLIRVTTGTLNIGTGTGNSLTIQNNTGTNQPTFILEGGTVNIAGRFEWNQTAPVCTLQISSGTMNVCTVGNTAANTGAMRLSNGNDANLLQLTGGQINIVRANSAGTASQRADWSCDYDLSNAGTIVQFGSAASPSAQTFNIQGLTSSPTGMNHLPNFRIHDGFAHTVNTLGIVMFVGTEGIVGNGTTFALNTFFHRYVNNFTLTINGGSVTRSSASLLPDFYNPTAKLNIKYGDFSPAGTKNTGAELTAVAAGNIKEIYVAASAANRIWSLQSNTTISGDVTMTGGTLALGSNSITLSDNRNVNMVDGVVTTGGSGAITTSTGKYNVRYNSFTGTSRNTGAELNDLGSTKVDSVVINPTAGKTIVLNSVSKGATELALQSGTFDLALDDFAMATAGSVRVSEGTATSSGGGNMTTVAGTYNVFYNTTAGTYTTGNELSTNASAIGNVTIDPSVATNVVSFGGARTVNGTLTITDGDITGGSNITFANASGLTINDAASTWSGIPNWAGTVNLNYTFNGNYTVGDEFPAETDDALKNLTVGVGVGNTLSWPTAKGNSFNNQGACTLTLSSGTLDLNTPGTAYSMTGPNSLNISYLGGQYINGNGSWTGNVSAGYLLLVQSDVNNLPAHPATVSKIIVDAGIGNTITLNRTAPYDLTITDTLYVQSGTLDIATGNSLTMGAGSAISRNGTNAILTSAAGGTLTVPATINLIYTDATSTTGEEVPAGNSVASIRTNTPGSGDIVTLDNANAPITVTANLYLTSGVLTIPTGDELILNASVPIFRVGGGSLDASAGAFTPSTGHVLTYSGASMTAGDELFTGLGSVEVNMTSGQALTINKTYSTTGAFNVNTGDVTYGTSNVGTIGGNYLMASSGTVTLGGSLTINGTTNFNAGTVQYPTSGSTSLYSVGDVNISASATVTGQRNTGTTVGHNWRIGGDVTNNGVVNLKWRGNIITATAGKTTGGTQTFTNNAASIWRVGSFGIDRPSKADKVVFSIPNHYDVTNVSAAANAVVTIDNLDNISSTTWRWMIWGLDGSNQIMLAAANRLPTTSSRTGNNITMNGIATTSGVYTPGSNDYAWPVPFDTTATYTINTASATNPGVLTVIGSTAGLSAGSVVMIRGTSVASLNEKFYRIISVSGLTVTVDADFTVTGAFSGGNIGYTELGATRGTISINAGFVPLPRSSITTGNFSIHQNMGYEYTGYSGTFYAYAAGNAIATMNGDFTMNTCAVCAVQVGAADPNPGTLAIGGAAAANFTLTSGIFATSSIFRSNAATGTNITINGPNALLYNRYFGNGGAIPGIDISGNTNMTWTAGGIALYGRSNVHDATAADLQFTTTGTVNVSPPATLYVAGTTNNTNATAKWRISLGGNAVLPNVSINPTNPDNILLISTGDVIIKGSLDLDNGTLLASDRQIYVGQAGAGGTILNNGGAITVNSSAPYASFYFNGAGSFTMPAGITNVQNLTVNQTSGSTVTLGANLAIGNGGAVTVGNSNLLDGGFSLSYDATSGSLLYNADVASTITAGPEWVASGSTRPSTVTLNMTSSGGVVDFSGSKAIKNTFVRKQGDLTTGTMTYDANGTLEYSGTGTLNLASGAIEWPATSGPTNVVLNGNVVNLPSGFNRTVSGDLTLESGTLALGANTLTVQGDVIGLTASPSAQVTNSTGKVLMQGSSAQIIAPITYGNLELNNSAGATVTNSNSGVAATAVFTDVLTLSDGVINTSDDDFIEVRNSMAGAGGEVALGARVGGNTNLVVGGTGAAIALPTIQDLRSLRSSRPGQPDPENDVCATIGSITNPAILAIQNFAAPLGYTKDAGAGVISLPGGQILTNVTYVGASSLNLSAPTTGTVSCSPNIMVNNMTVDLTGGNSVNLDCNLTVRGKLTLINGSINPGAFSMGYGVNGALQYEGTFASIGTEWPATSGPRSVTMATGSSVNINANRTLAGNFTVNTATTFSSGVTLTVNGDLTTTAVLGSGGNGTVLLTGGASAQNLSLDNASPVQCTIDLNNSNGFNLAASATIGTDGAIRFSSGALNLADLATLTYSGTTLNPGCGSCTGTIHGFQAGIGQPYTSSLTLTGTGAVTLPSINGLNALSVDRSADVTLNVALPCTTVSVASGKLVGTGSISYQGGSSALSYSGSVTEPGIAWPATSAGAPAAITVTATTPTLTMTLDGNKTIGAGTTLSITRTSSNVAVLAVGAGNSLTFTRNDGLSITGGTYTFPSSPPVDACSLDVSGGTFVYVPRQNAGGSQNFFDNANPGVVVVDQNSTLSFAGSGDIIFPYLTTDGATPGEVEIGTIIINRGNLGGDAVDFNNGTRHPAYAIKVYNLLHQITGGGATASFAAGDLTPQTGMEYRINTNGANGYQAFAGSNAYDLNYTGTGSRTVSVEYSSSRLRNLTIGTSGTVTFGSNLVVSGDLNQNAGTLAVGANTITISGDALFAGTSLTSTNNTANALAVAGDLTVNAGHTLTMSGSGHIRFNSSGVTPQLFNGTHAGVTNINITVDQSAAAGVTCSLPWTLTGSRTLNLINGNFSMGNTLTMAGIVYITRTAGTMDFAGGTGSIVRTGIMMDMITFPDNVFSTNPVVVNNLSINNSGAVSGITLGNQGMTINGALTLTDGDLIVGASSLNINGTISRVGANINTDNTSTLGLGGTSALTIPASTFFDTPVPLAALNISNTAGVTWNAQSIETGGVVTFQSGAATLTMPSGTKLDLLDAGSLSGETVGRYVIGNVERTATAMGTGGSDFGNIGYQISAGAGDMGNVTALRISGADGISSGNSNTGIARTFTITVDAQPSAKRLVRLSWLSNEDNGKDATKINMFRSTDGGATWSRLTNGFVDATAGQPTGHRMVAALTDHFSLYTVTDNDSPLPVSFLSLNAKRAGLDAKLTWSTASETNSAKFEIQRSVNGLVFETVGQLNSTGNSTTLRTYEYLDRDVATLGQSKLYYRIRNIDFDGTESFSPVAILNLKAEGGLVVGTAPNPFKNVMNLYMTTESKGTISFSITDAAGRTLSSFELEVAEGASAIPMAQRFEALPAGVYHLVVTSDSHTQRVKVVKE